MAGFVEKIAKRFGYLPKKEVEARATSFSLVEEEKFLKKFGLLIDSDKITTDVALGMSALYRCVWLISSALATAPLKVFRENESGGSEVDKTHPNYLLLSLRPNATMTSFTFRQSLWGQVLMLGNAVVVPKKNQYGRAKSLKLLEPDEYYFLDAEDDLLVVETKNNNVWTSDQYLHFKDFSLDGEIGRSRVGLSKKTLSTQLKAEKFLDTYYSKGTFLNGYLKTERKLTSTEQEEASKEWDNAYSGLNKAFTTPVLSLGTEYKEVTKTNVESQLMEFLNYSPMKIYQIFGVPPILASDTEKSTSFGKGIEDMFIQFRQTTILPFAVSAEQEINYKLFRSNEIGTYFVKHNLDVIERANYQSRMEGLSKGIQNGIYNPNDARKYEDLNPYKGGETYMVNGNMQRVEDVANGNSIMQKNNGGSGATSTQ